jgi:predicted flavoprotein YhiN
VLAQWLPARLAEGLLHAHGFAADARLADMPDAQLRKLGAAINQWTLTPSGSEGYKKAEVTRGGLIHASCRSKP